TRVAQKVAPAVIAIISGKATTTAHRSLASCDE
ncbi:MAG: hypothetical protein ACI8TP_004446, partial [Acidimicrobiales bacterium]